jgi:hypothetical protein
MPFFAVVDAGVATDGTASARAAAEQSAFVLPVELGHGAAWSGERSGPASIFTPRLLPGIAGPWFGLHLVASAPYRNPGWDAGAGARGELTILPLAENTFALQLALEPQYLFVAKNGRGAAGVLFRAGRLLQAGAWVGHDLDQKDTFLEITLNVDVLSLGDPVGSILSYNAMEQIPGDERR